MLATSWAKICNCILTHQADIFMCGFQPPRGKEAVGLLSFEQEGRLREPGSAAEAWLLLGTQRGLWGTASTRGSKGRDPAPGLWGRMEGSKAAPVPSPPWNPESRRCFCSCVTARLRPRAASEPPAAPSVAATATTRAPCQNQQAMFVASRAQLEVDMVQPLCTRACTSGAVLAEGACLGSGAGVWVARDGRRGGAWAALGT